MTVVVEWRQQWQMDREVYIIIMNTDGVVWQTTRLDYFIIIIFLLYYTPCGLYNEQEGGFGERHGRGTTHQCCFETAPANNNANGAWGDHRQRKTTSSSSCVVQSCNKENGLLCVYNIHGDADTTVCPPLVGRPGKFITANSEAVSVIRRVVQCKGNQSRPVPPSFHSACRRRPLGSGLTGLYL